MSSYITKDALEEDYQAALCREEDLKTRVSELTELIDEARRDLLGSMQTLEKYGPTGLPMTTAVICGWFQSAIDILAEVGP